MLTFACIIDDTSPTCVEGYCEYNCGFEHPSEKLVATHELTCSRNPDSVNDAELDDYDEAVDTDSDAYLLNPAAGPPSSNSNRSRRQKQAANGTPKTRLRRLELSSSAADRFVQKSGAHGDLLYTEEDADVARNGRIHPVLDLSMNAVIGLRRGEGILFPTKGRRNKRKVNVDSYLEPEQANPAQVYKDALVGIEWLIVERGFSPAPETPRRILDAALQKAGKLWKKFKKRYVNNTRFGLLLTRTKQSMSCTPLEFLTLLCFLHFHFLLNLI